jgi:hypothetical protein
MAGKPFIPAILFKPDRVLRGDVRAKKRNELEVKVHFLAANGTEKIVRCAVSHPHDLIPAIDVHDLARNRRGTVASQENPGMTKLSWIATTLKGRMFLVML